MAGWAGAALPARAGEGEGLHGRRGEDVGLWAGEGGLMRCQRFISQGGFNQASPGSALARETDPPQSLLQAEGRLCEELPRDAAIQHLHCMILALMVAPGQESAWAASSSEKPAAAAGTPARSRRCRC